MKQNKASVHVFSKLSISFLFFPYIPGHSCRLAPWILQPMQSQWRASYLTASSSRMMQDDARCLQLLQLLYRSKDLKIQTIVYFCENTARLQALSNFYRTIDDSASNPAPSIVRVESILVVSWVIWSAGVLNLFLQSFSVGDSTVIPLAAKESYRKGPTVVPLTSSFHHSKRAKASA